MTQIVRVMRVVNQVGRHEGDRPSAMRRRRVIVRSVHTTRQVKINNDQFDHFDLGASLGKDLAHNVLRAEVLMQDACFHEDVI